jgi:pullulanase
MMIDDFTAEFRGSRAPVDAVLDKVDYLVDLGVNAVEFMPWTAWPGSAFSWGYDPFLLFAVEYRYINDPADPLDKLFRLQRLIDALHERGIHVIMDGVFNHVQAGRAPDRGFPYYWLYQDPTDSPFIGAFAEGGFFEDFDFANRCTAEFVADVCEYWLEEYQIDGIRFDYVKGFYGAAHPPRGISRLIADLNAYAAASGRDNLALVLELLTDNRFEAIARTNEIAASGCWFDPLMWEAFDIARSGHIGTTLVRRLDAGRGFDADKRPVTYVENHDHSTLMEHAGGREHWWRTQPLAMALLTACGAVMIHNGQEFGEQYWFPEEGPGRVLPRPLRWGAAAEPAGRRLFELYRQLIAIRKAHPALRTQSLYPDPYDERLLRFDHEGYGVSVDQDVAIYHRWGTGADGRLERFIIALNFSDYPQSVTIPFPDDGAWRDLLSGVTAQVQGYRLEGQRLGSNWGRIYLKTG